MTVILYMVAASVGIGAGGLLLFLWALKNGQFEDLDGAAMRILLDDGSEEGRPKSAGPIMERKQS